MKKISGMFSAVNKKFAIVAARFNSLITERLVQGACDAIIAHEGDEPLVVWVPGALELGIAAKKIALTEQYDAIMCIGAVIKGDTDHYHYVASNAASSIAQLSLATGIPIMFGVLTTDTIEQALNRAGIKHGNAGYATALAAIETASVCEQIEKIHKK